MVQRIAFLAFPGLTLLDLVGAYDVLRRVPLMGIDQSVTHRIVGTKASLEDETGFAFHPDGIFEELKAFDLLVVPGGLGTRRLMSDERFLEYLRSWGKSRPLASVCTGSLLLGRAGYLKSRRATGHAGSFDLLAPMCKEVVRDERVIEDGHVTTAGGVSSSIDLGLHLVTRYWGEEARERIAAVMEYRGYGAPAPGPA
ncbi:MAG: DJ-1/PfpI family protein [Solirubrobacteraceae bacterium]